MINVKGLVNCLLDEVFEMTKEVKAVNTCLVPEIKVVNYSDLIDDSDNKEEDGYTTGCYIRSTYTVYLFKDVINTFLNKYDDVDEELYIINVLSHELTHFLQHINGEEFDLSLPYLDRPHEIEAREISEIVTIKYSEMYA